MRHFPALEPLRTFRGPREPSWVTMVTDGINAGYLFGGVGTAMVLSALMARRLGARLRLVTRTERAHPDNFAAVLSVLRVPWEGNIEFVHSPAGGGREVPVGDRDIFLTTSWWTTWCVRRAVDPRRIIYLLQEDERMFYPYGDERLRCSETLGDPDVRFVVNTEALFRHLVDGPEPLPNLRTNGVWFEPAFPAARTTDRRDRTTASRTSSSMPAPTICETSTGAAWRRSRLASRKASSTRRRGRSTSSVGTLRISCSRAGCARDLRKTFPGQSTSAWFAGWTWACR